MDSGRISGGRARRARVGAAASFLLTGFVSASWASRVPAIKDGLGLGDGRFAIALLGLEAGAVFGLQLGGLVVPRTGSRRALLASLVTFSGALVLPSVATSLSLLAAGLFLFAALNCVANIVEASVPFAHVLLLGLSGRCG